MPTKRAQPMPVTEEWECHCGEFCPPSFRYCVECGFPHGSVKPPPDDECGGCGEALGSSFNFCPDWCVAPPPRPWRNSCNDHLAARVPRCALCARAFVGCSGTEKGVWNKENAVKGSPLESGNDWKCGGCGDGMPADFAHCIVCGTKRPVDIS